MTISIPDITEAGLRKARTVDLVAFYNRKTGASILKFQDRATAERRCLEIIRTGKPTEKAPRSTRKFEKALDGAAVSLKDREVAPPNPKINPKKALGAVQAAVAERSAIGDIAAELSTGKARTVMTPVAGTRVHVAARRGPPPKHMLDGVIVVLVKENPKRRLNSAGEETLAWTEFEFYKTARTVRDYIDMGGQLAYLNYDVKRGFIRIDDPVATGISKRRAA